MLKISLRILVGSEFFSIYIYIFMWNGTPLNNAADLSSIIKLGGFSGNYFPAFLYMMMVRTPVRNNGNIMLK